MDIVAAVKQDTQVQTLHGVALFQDPCIASPAVTTKLQISNRLLKLYVVCLANNSYILHVVEILDS